MQRLKINHIIPLSEVRTDNTNFIKQVHETKRPLIITQHGKGVAVLLDAQEFEAMQEKLELLTDIQISLNQLESGEGIVIIHQFLRPYKTLTLIAPSSLRLMPPCPAGIQDYRAWCRATGPGCAAPDPPRGPGGQSI